MQKPGHTWLLSFQPAWLFKLSLTVLRMEEVVGMSASSILVVDQLYKSYGAGGARRSVVNGLSFSLRRGECYGLLGPNGAGKTTTLRLCLGLAEADSGTV